MALSPEKTVVNIPIECQVCGSRVECRSCGEPQFETVAVEIDYVPPPPARRRDLPAELL